MPGVTVSQPPISIRSSWTASTPCIAPASPRTAARPAPGPLVTAWSHALVTGGAGFIGSHLTRALLADGRRVTVLDNLSVGRRDAVPEGARFVHGDLRDEAASPTRCGGVDCVFHLAAQVTIRGSFDRFQEDLDTNVMGTARLLRAVDRERVKWFTLASSMAVYADADSPTPIDRSRIPSGRSRLTASASSPPRTSRIRSSEGRGIPFTAVRYFNTYGPGQTYTPYVGVLTIFITRLLRGESITVFGDGRTTARLHARQRHRRRHEGHDRHTQAGTTLGPGKAPRSTRLASMVLARVWRRASSRSTRGAWRRTSLFGGDIAAARQPSGLLADTVRSSAADPHDGDLGGAHRGGVCIKNRVVVPRECAIVKRVGVALVACHPSNCGLLSRLIWPLPARRLPAITSPTFAQSTCRRHRWAADDGRPPAASRRATSDSRGSFPIKRAVVLDRTDRRVSLRDRFLTSVSSAQFGLIASQATAWFFWDLLTLFEETQAPEYLS